VLEELCDLRDLTPMRKFPLLLLLLTLPVLAKAYHATRQEMLARAQVIAVVEVSEIQGVQIKGKHWTYSQRARARLLKPLKGKPADELVIYGGEDFECAQVQLHRGTCLVFLEPELEGYRGCNWGASCLPVADGRLPWLSGPETRHPDRESTLEQAEREIRQTLGSSPKH